MSTCHVLAISTDGTVALVDEFESRSAAIHEAQWWSARYGDQTVVQDGPAPDTLPAFEDPDSQSPVYIPGEW